MDYKEFNAEFYQLKMQYEDGDRSSELLNNIRSLIENAKEEISENHPEILSMGYLWFTICEAYRKMTDLAERLTEIYFPVIDNERPYRWRTDIHLDYNNKAIVLDIDLGDEIKPVNLAALKEALGNPEYRLMLNETARYPTVKFVCNIANTDISNICDAENWLQDKCKEIDYIGVDDVPPAEEHHRRDMRM